MGPLRRWGRGRRKGWRWSGRASEGDRLCMCVCETSTCTSFEPQALRWWWGGRTSVDPSRLPWTAARQATATTPCWSHRCREGGRLIAPQSSTVPRQRTSSGQSTDRATMPRYAPWPPCTSACQARPRMVREGWNGEVNMCELYKIWLPPPTACPRSVPSTLHTSRSVPNAVPPAVPPADSIRKHSLRAECRCRPACRQEVR